MKDVVDLRWQGHNRQTTGNPVVGCDGPGDVASVAGRPVPLDAQGCSPGLADGLVHGPKGG
eukprot:9402036-Lingulodinium_polyedra.AAC.1